MRKTYSLVLMAAALLFGTQAKADFAADWNYAVLNGGTIVLNDDVEIGADLTPLDGQSVIIDLNGNDLDLQTYLLQVKRGSLTITGEGNVLMSGSADSRYRQFLVSGSGTNEAGYTTVTIDEKVTVYHTSGYGISVMQATGTQASYGVTLNIKGTVIGLYGGIQMIGNIQATSGNVPVVNIESAAKVQNITPDNDGAGIYAAGYAIWNIKGEVSGVTGIYAKSGVFNIVGANIAATGDWVEPKAKGSGFEGAGDAITFDTMNGYSGHMELNISDNASITAADGYAINEIITGGTSHSEFIKMDITSGSFDGSKGGITTSGDVKSKLQAGELGPGITGGEFSNDAADMMGYLNASVSEAAEVVDGKVIVAKKNAEFIEREGLSVGKFGTICYEYGSKNYAGATFFQIESFDESEIVLVEVAELYAGMPYIFEASAAKIMIEKQSEPMEDTLFAPYLVGSFNQTLVPAGKHVISNNKAMLCGENCSIEAHRAYIDLSAPAAPAPARVGGKRYMMSINNEATELEVAEAVKAGRPVFMHNGKLFIMKDKAMYHVSGAQMR